MTHVCRFFFIAFYKLPLFYRISPAAEQQGCFHRNAEESDWQSAASLLLLPDQNKLPLHYSKYWAFPEPSGGERGDLREVAQLRLAGVPRSPAFLRSGLKSTAAFFPSIREKSFRPLPAVFSKRISKWNVELVLCEHNILKRAWEDYITNSVPGIPQIVAFSAPTPFKKVF